MTRDEILKQIEKLELVNDVGTAIDDVSAMQRDPEEQGLVDVSVTDRTTGKRPVAFLHALPPSILQVGLKAIQAALEEQLQMEKVHGA